MQKFRLGLVVADPAEDAIRQAEKYVAEGGAEIDAYLFPEGYLKSDRLPELQEIARKASKWIFSGMEDGRVPGHKFETGVIINPAGEIVGEHKKTSITKYEVEHGTERGNSIQVIDTPLGKIGFAICFEIHFPEIARVLTLAGVEIILNPIGTGMWHEHQFQVWNSIARARSSENNVFVCGVSHRNDAIPLAYAYAPGGECLVVSRGERGLIPVVLDPEKFSKKWRFNERRPDLYGPLVI